MAIPAEVLQNIKDFESCVFTFIDRNGYPFSFPSRLKVVEDVLELSRPGGTDEILPEKGKADILLHSFDEEVASMKQSRIIGTFEAKERLVFRPTAAFIMPKAGLSAFLRFILSGGKFSLPKYEF